MLDLRGIVSLGADDEPERAGAAPRTADAGKPKKPQGAGGRDVGAALRTVYQKTVEERIPDEFLDLLGKLG